MSSAAPPAGAVRIAGIAGGTGAGKTTLARALAAAWPGGAALVAQDAYYRNLAHLDAAARAALNFDEPAALELDRLARDLDALRRGDAIEVPVYDFDTHLRRPETRRIPPAPLVVVEGLFVLSDPALRARCDLAVFVDAPAALRRARRIARDTAERGRSPEEARLRFDRHTEPMYRLHIAPARAGADLIVSGEAPLPHTVTRLLAHPALAAVRCEG